MIRTVLGLLVVPLLGWSLLGAVAAGAQPHQPTVPSSAVSAATGVTTVSLTFDGTFASQVGFSRILAERGLAGTFYVNSGYLGYPAYLDVDEVRSIARDRNEIAGASMLGADLTRLPGPEMDAQICDDRATLAQLGFQTTSFAYPRGAQDPQVKAAVQRCGYNSARRSSGLFDSSTSCSSCPVAETVPATDDYRIRTSPQTSDPAELRSRVDRAARHGGGWVPLVFTKICVCPDEDDAISPDAFRAFVAWLDGREATIVRTVDQVMGGPMRTVHGVPLPRLVADPSPAISTEAPLSRTPAWTLWNQGIGQSQIILVGVLLAIAVSVTFRLATRSARHGR